MNTAMSLAIAEMVRAESANTAATIERKNAATSGNPNRWSRAITASVAAQTAYSVAVYRVQTAELVAKAAKAQPTRYEVKDKAGRSWGTYASWNLANAWVEKAEDCMTLAEIRATKFTIGVAR